MNNDFCFIVISFNQENYVTQHLESIRYQIGHYGLGKKIQIVFSDDASKDKTLRIAKEWLNDNKDLFAKIDIIEHKQNIGTVQNMYEAIMLVDAPKHKMLACDDMYYVNNIFKLHNKADVVITPTLQFFDNNEIIDELTPEYIRFLKYRNDPNLKEKIAKMLDFAQCIPTPGIFMSDAIWKNESFWKFIKKYKYIEDVSMFYYIFNRYKKPFSIHIESKPYILYRRGVGISIKINKKKDNPIDLEYREIRKKIISKELLFPKYLNPYIYKNYFLNHFLNKIWIKNLQDDMNVWKNDTAKFVNYFNLIKRAAKK